MICLADKSKRSTCKQVNIINNGKTNRRGRNKPQNQSSPARQRTRSPRHRQTHLAHRTSFPTKNAVVYLGHLPYGFQEEQLKSYFGQYGDVLGVKVARSKKTARSKGYAFVQFRYPEVASVVSDTMNGYLLLGKVIVSHVLNADQKNPFVFGSSRQYKFINWKRLFIKKHNSVLSLLL